MSAAAGGRIRFSFEEACEIADLPGEVVESLRRAAVDELEPCFMACNLSGLAALMILRELHWRLGGAMEAYSPGLGQVLSAVVQESDHRRLAAKMAVIGRDFGRLCELSARHLHFTSRDLVLLPLRPLIAELHDRVFA